MGESPWYIGKMEGDFINNILCKYNFFGKSLTKLYYRVKWWRITSTICQSLVKNGELLRNGESLEENGESLRNPRVLAVAWHQEGIQEETVKKLDKIVAN